MTDLERYDAVWNQFAELWARPVGEVSKDDLLMLALNMAWLFQYIDGLRGYNHHPSPPWLPRTQEVQQ